MKRLIGAVLLTILLPPVALAQDSDASKGHGYVYFAPVGYFSYESAGFVQIGGGAEGFFAKYVGIGADAGYMAYYGPEEAYLNAATVSLNCVARIRPKTSDNEYEPFVTGGYTHFFPRYSGSHGPGFNFGGGINRWFTDHMGLRFEVRDSIEFEGGGHYVSFRIGLTFG